MKQPYIIAGLGNPGDKYKKTRHNVAWQLFDQIFIDDGWSFNKYANADMMATGFADHDVYIVKPQTFMNNSGDSVAYVADKQYVDAQHIVVVHDDLDVPLGSIKISQSKGAGGNNGVASIAKQLGTKDFVRVRIGVAPVINGSISRPSGEQQKDFVLQRFTAEEEKIVQILAKKLAKILRTIVAQGVQKAMNQANAGR